MLDFNQKDQNALNWMFDKVRPLLENATEEQKENFQSLFDKCQIALNHDVNISITSEDVDNAFALIEELDAICGVYYSAQTDSSPEIYDDLQRDLLSKLDYFSTLKSKFLSEAEYLKEKVGKEVKSRISALLVEEDGISLAQANIQSARDIRYTSNRDAYYKVREIAIRLKERHQHYTDTQKAIMQSFSRSNKDRYQTRN